MQSTAVISLHKRVFLFAGNVRRAGTIDTSITLLHRTVLFASHLYFVLSPCLKIQSSYSTCSASRFSTHVSNEAHTPTLNCLCDVSLTCITNNPIALPARYFYPVCILPCSIYRKTSQCVLSLKQRIKRSTSLIGMWGRPDSTSTTSCNTGSRSHG